MPIEIFNIIKYCESQGFKISYLDYERETARLSEINITLLHAHTEEE